MNTANLSSLEIIGALAIFLLNKTGSIYGEFVGRLSAAEQREAFGCVPFGKLRFRINGTNEIVTASRKVCFGTDFESSSFGWLEFETLCRSNRHPFSLGRYSKKYNTLPL